MSGLHLARRRVRDSLRDGRRLVGTFVKIATPDVIELAAGARLDFVVVDLEHSTLTGADAIGLVRHADLCGLPALVRVPAVDAPLIARLLENGAAGVQLSTLRRAAEREALRNACLFAPWGSRSVSLANRAAAFGSVSLGDLLAAEAADPPLLVGQIETRVEEPLEDVLQGLDVAFVGTTDLEVSLGMPPREELVAAVSAVRDAALTSGTAFGGWIGALADIDLFGIAEAQYLVVGSDLQLLARGLKAVLQEERS